MIRTSVGQTSQFQGGPGMGKPASCYQEESSIWFLWFWNQSLVFFCSVDRSSLQQLVTVTKEEKYGNSYWEQRRVSASQRFWRCAQTHWRMGPISGLGHWNIQVVSSYSKNWALKLNWSSLLQYMITGALFPFNLFLGYVYLSPILTLFAPPHWLGFPPPSWSSFPQNKSSLPCPICYDCTINIFTNTGYNNLQRKHQAF